MNSDKINKESFALRLQAIRKQLQLSQLELAERSKLQPTAISHYENSTRRPSLANLSKLATALQVTVDYLIGHSDDLNSSSTPDRYLIGWRETVSIPNWNVTSLTAKIDTGARTSSIHVANIKHLHDNRISFDVVLRRRKPKRVQPVETTYLRMTNVKSSNGHIQERLVVRERVHIGDIDKEIELTLSVRDSMTCRMLLGRSALQTDFLINVDDTFIAT